MLQGRGSMTGVTMLLATASSRRAAFSAAGRGISRGTKPDADSCFMQIPRHRHCLASLQVLHRRSTSSSQASSTDWSAASRLSSSVFASAARSPTGSAMARFNKSETSGLILLLLMQVCHKWRHSPSQSKVGRCPTSLRSWNITAFDAPSDAEKWELSTPFTSSMCDPATDTESPLQCVLARSTRLLPCRRWCARL